MARVIFYEKPGCISNNRQKKLLMQSGHTVVVKDLLSENWSANRSLLRAFFTGLPVTEWFNRSAPAIKQGLIDPNTLNGDQAIRFMLSDPLLIRRALMQVGEEKMAGFDEQKVNNWIGLAANEQNVDLENCPKAPLKDRCHD